MSASWRVESCTISTSAGSPARQCCAYFGSDQLHERILEVRCARACAQFIGAALGDDATVRDHHDAVAQGGDLLHDVAGKDHAAAFAAQMPQEVAQSACRHDIQAVGGF